MKTNKKIVIIATSIILATFLAFATINEQTSAAIALAKQMTFGGGAGDFAQAVAMWGTKKVIVGYTYSFAGHSDVFVAVNDTTLGMWTFGTSMDEQAFAVAIHGNVAYIVGTINYAVSTNINYFDIFVAKWDLMNNQLLGFIAIGKNQVPLADVAFAVAADANFVFVTGRWADDKAFLAIVHAPSFSLVKFLQLDIAPASNEFAFAVDFTISGGTYIIIVGGATNHPSGFGDYDAFLARIDWDGSTATYRWALRFGTSLADGVTSIKFVSPTTFAVGGTLEGNGFIGYFTIDGGFLNARATVFSSTSIITSLAWNGTHLAAAGYFNNFPNQDDAYVLLIDRNGLLVDAKGYGGGTIDRAHGVAIDTSNVHVVGITSAFPNPVFTPSPFSYKEVQVGVFMPPPTPTLPYMRMGDLTSTLVVALLTLGTDFNVNPLTPPVFPRSPTFNSPVNGDAFYVRFTT